jgi:hypothetical protein
MGFTTALTEQLGIESTYLPIRLKQKFKNRFDSQAFSSGNPSWNAMGGLRRALVRRLERRWPRNSETPFEYTQKSLELY